MKTIFLLTQMLLLGIFAFGQDSTATRLNHMYFQLGSTIPLSSQQDNIFSLSFIGSTKVGSAKKNLDFNIGLYSRSFTDKNLAGLDYNSNQRPIHEVGELNLSVGKITDVGTSTLFTFFAGPSFVIYYMPYNIRQRPSSGWWGSTGLDYETRTYLLLGGTARADFSYFPIKKASLGTKNKYESNLGMSVGGLVNWNRKLTSWGLNISLILGGRALSN